MTKILVLLAVTISIVSSQAVDENGIEQFVVARGSDFNLICNAEETRKCDLSAKYHIADRRSSKRDRFRIHDGKACIIGIRNVELADSDLYKCDHGDYYTPFRLTVFVDEDRFKTLTVEKGSDVTLDCSTEETDRCSLLNSNSDILVDRNEPKKGRFEIRDNKTCIFTIRNVQFADKHWYRCKIGRYYFTYDLNVYIVSSKAVEEDGSKHLLVEMGRSVQLECSVQETDTCSLFNSNSVLLVDRLQSKSKFYIQHAKTCIIDIFSVQFEDSDLYTCAAGSDFIKYRLNVVVSLAMLVNNNFRNNNSRNVISTFPDRPTYIECRSYGGYPNATINWFVDNKPQNHSHTYQTLSDKVLEVASFIRYEDIVYSMDGSERPREIEVRCEVDHSYGRKVVVAVVGEQYATTHVTLSVDQPHKSTLDGPRVVTCMGNGLPTADDFKIMRETDVKGKYDVIAQKATHTITTPGVYRCAGRNYEHKGGPLGDYVVSDDLTLLNPVAANNSHHVSVSNAGSSSDTFLCTRVN